MTLRSVIYASYYDICVLKGVILDNCLKGFLAWIISKVY